VLLCCFCRDGYFNKGIVSMTLSFSATHITQGVSCCAVSAVVLLVTSHPGFAQDRPVSGGTLTWGIETQPTTLNPQLNGQDKVALVLRNAYESLLAQSPDGSFVPWLATGYSISADGKTYTFTLRDDVRFTDGAPFDAQAVSRNLLKLRDPTYSGAFGLALLSPHFLGVKTPDARTVVITLDEPYTPFLTLIARLPLLSPKVSRREVRKLPALDRSSCVGT
jgi:peptide/nickel transport system substrate-binding protein